MLCPRKEGAIRVELIITDTCRPDVICDLGSSYFPDLYAQPPTAYEDSIGLVGGNPAERLKKRQRPVKGGPPPRREGRGSQKAPVLRRRGDRHFQSGQDSEGPSSKLKGAFGRGFPLPAPKSCELRNRVVKEDDHLLVRGTILGYMFWKNKGNF